MTLHLSVILLQLAAGPTPTAAPISPPAAAMKPQQAATVTPTAASATPPSPATPDPKDTPATDADDSDAPPDSEESATEMEAMRALEQVALNPAAKPSAEVQQAIRRLGFANPLRHRMQEAYDEADLREDAAPAELARITDLSNFDVALVKDEYDIPVEMQPLVAQYIQFFQGAGRKWFRRWMSRSTRYIPMMQPILQQRGMPKDTVYLAMIESGFSPEAYSWARASGPWQFIAGTGKRFGLKQDFWVDERRDPVKATEAAAKFLTELHKDLGNWYLSWAAYNAGGGKVHRVMLKKGTRDFWELSEGKGLAQETKHYVPKLIACALVAKHPKAFGFTDDEFEYLPPLEYEDVRVSAPTDLEVVARAAGATVGEIRELNPELKRWCTPPATDQNPYLLRVPKNKAATFAENFPKIAPTERLNFKIHRVARGETLSLIAANYHSAPEAIMQLNRLKNVRALKVNSDLVVPVPGGKAAKEGQDATADVQLQRQVAKARRSGFTAVRPEEEIPAGSRTKSVATGPIKTETINGKTHVQYAMESGDNLWTISQRFNCSVDDLRKWNSLGRHPKKLQIGTVLSIWQGEASAATVENRSGTLIAQKTAAPPVVPVASSGKHTTHTIASGDSLWTVSQRYGVTVEDLKKWNGITGAKALQPGQQLTVAAP